MSVAFVSDFSPRGIRLYCVLPLRLTVWITLLSALTTIWFAVASIALTSPITPLMTGAVVGDAVGVCPCGAETKSQRHHRNKRDYC